MHRLNRLRSPGEIRAAMRTGKRVATPSVVALVQGPSGASVAAPKATVIAGRRIGGAVIRNRAKRRLRAAAQARIERLPEGSRVVLVATLRTAATSFERLEEDVATALAPPGRSERSGRRG